jgi:RAB protein geranylgeranyltransferase component A
MSEDASSYPPIELSNFDLIVLGTGLPESMIAAATSANNKTVLHLDPNPFYASHYASLSLLDLG